MVFNIEFDYRFDTNGFFADAASKATLEAAADIWESFIQDEFTNVPAGIQFSVQNPQTGQLETVVLTSEIDDLLIFVGASSTPFGDEAMDHALAAGTFNGVDAAGSVFSTRLNSSNFEPWVGNISFDSSPSFSDGAPSFWFFDSTPDTSNDIPAGSVDFLSTALHEIGHVLGIGSAPIFLELGAGASFVGANALALEGGTPIPLDSDLDHVESGFLSDGQPVLMAGANPGGRRLLTEVDLAILADIGYEIPGFIAQGSTPPITTEGDDIVIFGTVVDDVIDGLGGDDQIQGDQGNDTLKGGSGNDLLFGQDGNDFLFGNEGSDHLQGQTEDDTLIGGIGDDQLFGQEGNDFLFGQEGSDQLQGGIGNDRLDGGVGNDLLFGQDGIDTFAFGANNGADQIADFDVTNEVIHIASGLGFTTGADVFATFSQPFSNVSRFTLSPGNTIDVFHDVMAGTPLTAADFMIV